MDQLPVFETITKYQVLGFTELRRNMKKKIYEKTKREYKKVCEKYEKDVKKSIQKMYTRKNT